MALSRPCVALSLVESELSSSAAGMVHPWTGRQPVAGHKQTNCHSISHWDSESNMHVLGNVGGKQRWGTQVYLTCTVWDHLEI